MNEKKTDSPYAFVIRKETTESQALKTPFLSYTLEKDPSALVRQLENNKDKRLTLDSFSSS